MSDTNQPVGGFRPGAWPIPECLRPDGLSSPRFGEMAARDCGSGRSGSTRFPSPPRAMRAWARGPRARKLERPAGSAGMPRAVAPRPAQVDLWVPERGVKPKDSCWTQGCTACTGSLRPGKSCCGREIPRPNFSGLFTGFSIQRRRARPGLVAAPSAPSIWNPESGGVQPGVFPEDLQELEP